MDKKNIQQRPKTNRTNAGTHKAYARGRRFKTASVKDLTAPLLRKALGNTAPAIAQLIENWMEIAPQDLAQVTQVSTIRFPNRHQAREGLLELRVKAEAAFIIEHSSQRLIEAVNLYFGYQVIKSIKLQQVTNFTASAPNPNLGPNPAHELAVPAKPQTGIQDPELAQSLANLKALVERRENRKG